MNSILHKLKKRLIKLRYRLMVRPKFSCRDCREKTPTSKYHSQYGQDCFIADLLNQKKSGVFVEIGVGEDGVLISNSYYFEKNLGWTGLLVEPHPTYVEQIRRNRTCTVVGACISNFTGTAEFLALDGNAQALSGLVEDYHDDHKARINKEAARNHCSQQVIKVPVLQFNDVMRDHGITKIDYLSIDTEGSEAKILADIDFSLVDISIISVENNYRELFFHRFLTSKNYELMAILGRDEIYKKSA